MISHTTLCAVLTTVTKANIAQLMTCGRHTRCNCVGMGSAAEGPRGLGHPRTWWSWCRTPVGQDWAEWGGEGQRGRRRGCARKGWRRGDEGVEMGPREGREWSRQQSVCTTKTQKFYVANHFLWSNTTHPAEQNGRPNQSWSSTRPPGALRFASMPWRGALPNPTLITLFSTGSSGS